MVISIVKWYTAIMVPLCPCLAQITLVMTAEKGHHIIVFLPAVRGASFGIGCHCRSSVSILAETGHEGYPKAVFHLLPGLSSVPLDEAETVVSTQVKIIEVGEPGQHGAAKAFHCR